MREKLEKAWADCLGKLENTMREMPNPPAEYASCADGYYFRHPPFLPFSHIGTWMTSFFTGQALLAYHRSGNGRYLDWLAGYYPAYEKKLTETPEDTMHDLGFLYTLYSTGYYRETGDEAYRILSLRAAKQLAKRMDPKCGLIRAWGRLDETEHHSAGLAIIDCMMNLPLLFFAWKEGGDPLYLRTALRHAKQTRNYFIRGDGSVCHGYQYREAQGVPRGEVNHCGYQKGSFWARGLAWAMYGYTLVYRWTGEREYRTLAGELSDRFLLETARAGGDPLVPPWDFRLGEGMEKLRDTSAAAIAACALCELGKEEGGERFFQSGLAMLERLTDEYRDHNPESSGLLRCSNGKEHCTSFGDYFYMEALLRYLDGFEGYWQG